MGFVGGERDFDDYFNLAVRYERIEICGGARRGGDRGEVEGDHLDFQGDRLELHLRHEGEKERYEGA